MAPRSGIGCGWRLPVKFLVSFSLLIGIGSQVAWRRAPVLLVQPRLTVVRQIRLPIGALASPASLFPPRAPSRLPGILLSLWLCGFSANSLAWYQRVRAVLCDGSPLHLHLPIPAMTTAACLEPGVFGVLRPILLLPDGLGARLTPAQFDAIVEHELCHVGRRDNSSLAIHMLVEALLWFHPLV
jgi:bla regulator protein BlaR1